MSVNTVPSLNVVLALISCSKIGDGSCLSGNPTLQYPDLISRQLDNVQLPREGSAISTQQASVHALSTLNIHVMSIDLGGNI